MNKMLHKMLTKLKRILIRTKAVELLKQFGMHNFVKQYNMDIFS